MDHEKYSYQQIESFLIRQSLVFKVFSFHKYILKTKFSMSNCTVCFSNITSVTLDVNMYKRITIGRLLKLKQNFTL